VEESATLNANRAFLLDEFFSLTLMAAVQRGDVYAADAPESARRKFRLELRRKSEEMASRYHTPLAEEVHLKNIRSLADYLTKNHSTALKAGRFRIGTAQKALNLYLKYLWCIKAIPEPPHCPFDFQIIKLLSGFGHVRWTTLDDIDSYKLLVAAARRAAGSLSIAQWELEAYNAVTRAPHEN
jgi:hypothetical protein